MVTLEAGVETRRLSLRRCYECQQTVVRNEDGFLCFTLVVHTSEDRSLAPIVWCSPGCVRETVRNLPPRPRE